MRFMQDTETRPLVDNGADWDRPRRVSQAGRVKLFVAAMMAVLAIGYLMFSATQTSAVYYMTIPEVEALGSEAMTQQVRVGGMVVPGSIERDGTTLRFRIVDAEPETPPEVALQSDRLLTVVYGGVVPDIFQNEVHVVVEGKLTPAGEFDARTLLAKCPSRFEAAPGDQPVAVAPGQR
jgi:cytochrome c-type biogenesis protein CcmE